MSEPKAMTVFDAYQLARSDNDLVYLKSEADKYIGELKKERDWLAKDRAQAYDDLEKRAQLNIKQEESIRHQKSSGAWRCCKVLEAADAGSEGGKMIEPKLTVSDGTVSTCIEIDRRHIEAIAHEYWAAKEKHPKFCSAIIDPTSSRSWAEAEYRIKLRNQRGPEYADNLLMEEIAEAFAAYKKGDKTQALQEFAQCGALILRIMENVQNELEEKK